MMGWGWWGPGIFFMLICMAAMGLSATAMVATVPKAESSTGNGRAVPSASSMTVWPGATSRSMSTSAVWRRSTATATSFRERRCAVTGDRDGRAAGIAVNHAR